MTGRDRAQPALPGIVEAGDQRTRRVFRGVEAQLRAQRATGQLEPVDAGLVALARTLAEAVDSEWSDPAGSRYTVAAIAGRLAPVLLELRGERRDSASDVDYDAELVALTAAIRDAARSRPADDRPHDAGAPGPPAPQ